MYITDKLNSYIHNIFSIQYTYVIKKYALLCQSTLAIYSFASTGGSGD